jgi:hypothetical protein
MGHGLGLIHEPVVEWPPAFLWTARHLHARAPLYRPRS